MKIVYIMILFKIATSLPTGAPSCSLTPRHGVDGRYNSDWTITTSLLASGKIRIEANGTEKIKGLSLIASSGEFSSFTDGFKAVSCKGSSVQLTHTDRSLKDWTSKDDEDEVEIGWTVVHSKLEWKAMETFKFDPRTGQIISDDL
eukprot:GHVL01007534.1.p1 GENE.GHVL01007534.1~~GHVL01007534.1.p1  ORF type:complete len:145 (-),score=20.81 GHVL01007534.1:54-488(-)